MTRRGFTKTPTVGIRSIYLSLASATVSTHTFSDLPGLASHEFNALGPLGPTDSFAERDASRSSRFGEALAAQSSTVIAAALACDAVQRTTFLGATATMPC